MKPYDCCKSEWKEKLKIAYNLAQEAIRKITFNGKAYTPDGSGAVTLDNPKADDIDLTDGRSVQTAVDAIEDEIGDDDTAGSLRQYADRALYSLENSVSNAGTLVKWKGIKIDGIRNDGRHMFAYIGVNNNGLEVTDEKLSDSTLIDTTVPVIRNTGVTDIGIHCTPISVGITQYKGDTSSNVNFLIVSRGNGLKTELTSSGRLRILFDPTQLDIPKIFNFSENITYEVNITPSTTTSFTGKGIFRSANPNTIPLKLVQNGNLYAFGRTAETIQSSKEHTYYNYGVSLKDILDSDASTSWLRNALGVEYGYYIHFTTLYLTTGEQYVFYDTSSDSIINPSWMNIALGLKSDGSIYYNLENNDWSTIYVCGLNQDIASVYLGIAGEYFTPGITPASS